MLHALSLKSLYVLAHTHPPMHTLIMSSLAVQDVTGGLTMAGETTTQAKCPQSGESTVTLSHVLRIIWAIDEAGMLSSKPHLSSPPPPPDYRTVNGCFYCWTERLSIIQISHDVLSILRTDCPNRNVLCFPFIETGSQ